LGGNQGTVERRAWKRSGRGEYRFKVTCSQSETLKGRVGLGKRKATFEQLFMEEVK